MDAQAATRALVDVQQVARDLEQFKTRWQPVSANLVEWAQALYRSWNEQDVDAIVALCTEDVTLESPALSGDVVRGQDDLLRFADAFTAAFPDFQIEPIGPPYLAVDGHNVSQAWRASATFSGPLRMFPLRSGGPTFAPTGRRFQVEGVNLYEFRDGLLSRQQFFYDRAQVLEQLGLIPERGGRAIHLLSWIQRLRARLARRS